MTKAYRAELLLEGDVTAFGVVRDCTGRGDNVEVVFRDSGVQTFARGELIEVERRAA